MIWDIVVINLCKSVYWLMRRRGSHGAALPGLIAEKLNSRLLLKLTTFPEGVIVVSGTNGKTTTTHLTAEVLRRMGKRVFTNHSGSNMTRGLLASIIRYSTKTGRLEYDVAVLEIDEAYAAKLAPILNPRACILTNVLRDQLDRFGEIDHTAKLLGELTKHTTKLVCYNASDGRLRSLHDSKAKAKFVSYGFAPELVSHFPDDDALYDSKERILPSTYTYTLLSKEGARITIGHGSRVTESISPQLTGWHNALNLCAVVSLATELYGVQNQEVFRDLSPPYGRGEVIKVGSGEYILQLVKNPAGFRTAMDVAVDQPALVVINDQIADGRDVSWLWDLELDSLCSRPSVATSGTRAYDMAVRLKYSGVTAQSIDPDETVAITKFTKENKKGVLFLTYTAMLRSRKILKGLES